MVFLPYRLLQPLLLVLVRMLHLVLVFEKLFSLINKVWK